MNAERAPDYFAPVVGWRVWTVVHSGRELRLRSVAFDSIWHPHQELDAHCRARTLVDRLRRRRAHEPPSTECQCGIHAAKELHFASGYLSAYDDVLATVVEHRVIGRVSLWGTVAEGDLGWRASRAYPAHLYVPPRRSSGRSVDADAIARSLALYGVPVEVLDADRNEELVAVLAEAGQWRGARGAVPRSRRALRK